MPRCSMCGQESTIQHQCMSVRLGTNAAPAGFVPTPMPVYLGPLDPAPKTPLTAGTVTVTTTRPIAPGDEPMQRAALDLIKRAEKAEVALNTARENEEREGRENQTLRARVAELEAAICRHVAAREGEHWNGEPPDRPDITVSRLYRIYDAIAKRQTPSVSTGPEPSRERCPGLHDRARLTHVAVRDTEGRIWSLPRPCRHYQVVNLLVDYGAKKDDESWSEGFLDAHGHYLTRKQALVNADLHDQIKGGKTIASILTSEDLW